MAQCRFKIVVFQLFKNAVKTVLALTVSEINRFLVFTILQVILIFCLVRKTSCVRKMRCARKTCERHCMEQMHITQHVTHKPAHK